MFYIFLDFESTCLSDKIIPNQEIIEFPMIVYRDTEKVAEFHSYVKPVHNPISEFCTLLTGITPETVKDAPDFKTVYKSAIKFLDETIGTEPYTFVTCGDWDLKVMLPAQCNLVNTKVHPFFSEYINIKKKFKAMFKNVRFSNIRDMLKCVSIKFVGNLHSGIDDARNIARLFFAMNLHKL